MRRIASVLATIPAVRAAERTRLEDAFAAGLRMFGKDLPAPVREYAFAKETCGRNWRMDFAWPDLKVAVEIHGGAHLGHRGGHTSAAGLKRDSEKSTAANILGWSLLTFTSDDVKPRRLSETVEKVRAAINAKEKAR